MDISHSHGFKSIVALRGETGRMLAHEFRPDAILLDIGLPDEDGWYVLDHLKRSSGTRHIPVHVISAADENPTAALGAGAAAYFTKPVRKEELDQVFNDISRSVAQETKRLLIVQNNAAERESIRALLHAGDGLEITAVASSKEALKRLAEEHYDCIVLDLKLPKMTGFELLDAIKEHDEHRKIPVIIYTGTGSGTGLTRKEETRLNKLSDTMVIKTARSPERLLDDTALFLHRIESQLPEGRRQMLKQLHADDSIFDGRRILIIDDDVRNVFALTSALESHGMDVIYAENGREGIELLKQNPDAGPDTHGRHDARDGWLRDDAADSQPARVSAAAHHLG